MHDTRAGVTDQSSGQNSVDNLFLRCNSQTGPGHKFTSRGGYFPGIVEKIGTWNVEGLGYKDGFSMKSEELTRWML